MKRSFFIASTLVGITTNQRPHNTPLVVRISPTVPFQDEGGPRGMAGRIPSRRATPFSFPLSSPPGPAKRRGHSHKKGNHIKPPGVCLPVTSWTNRFARYRRAGAGPQLQLPLLWLQNGVILFKLLNFETDINLANCLNSGGGVNQLKYCNEMCAKFGACKYGRVVAVLRCPCLCLGVVKIHSMHELTCLIPATC